MSWNSAPTKKAFGIQDQQTSNNQQGTPAAYVAGTRKMAATWLSPVYNLQASEVGGKKGGGKKSGGGGNNQWNYNYFGTIAGGICIGPVDALLSIIVDGNEVWPGGIAWAVGQNVALGQAFVYDGQTYVAQQAHVASLANAPPNPVYWAEYEFAHGAELYDDITVPTGNVGKDQVANFGTLRIYWGLPGQVVDPNLTAAGNNWQHQHPNYQGLCYVVLINWLLGQGTTNAPNLEMVIRRTPQQAVVTGAPASLKDGQANLVAVASEVLTDQNMLGQPGTLIDDITFNAAAGLLDAQAGLCAGSAILDSQETLKSVLQRIQEMTDNWIRYNPSNLLIETGIYQHGVTPAAYTTITAVDLTERPKLTARGWSEAKSRTVVRFNDRAISYEQNSEKADDPRAFFVLGEHRSDNLDRPWICRDAQAIQHGRETLRVTGRPQLTAEIVVRREIGRAIRPGSYVLLDVDLEPNVTTIYQFFRVTERTIPQVGPIKFSLLADLTLNPIVWTDPTPPVLRTQGNVEPIVNLRILEGTVGLTGESGAVVVVAQRPDDLISGFHLYFDTATGGTFSSVLGGQTTFAGLATLSAAITAAATAIPITVANQVDMLRFTTQPGALAAADDTLLCILVSTVAAGGDAGQVAENAGGYQIMEVCSISASTLTAPGQYTLTVVRGRRNTTALAWGTANTEVWIVPLSGLVAFNHAEFAVLRSNRAAGLAPNYGYFRLTPFTYLAELALSQATSEPFHFPLRSPSAPNLTLTAPAAPGNAVLIANPPYPYAMTVSGTWADADGNMVNYQILLQKSTDASARLIYESVFSPSGSKTFSQVVWLESAGTYFLTLKAVDATGLTTTQVITVTATGAGAKVMVPVPTINGRVASLYPPAVESGFGPLGATCQTPGSTIWWASRYAVQYGANLAPQWSAWSNPVALVGNTPVHQNTFSVYRWPSGQTVPWPVSYWEFAFWATAAAMTGSDQAVVRFKDASYV